MSSAPRFACRLGLALLLCATAAEAEPGKLPQESPRDGDSPAAHAEAGEPDQDDSDSRGDADGEAEEEAEGNVDVAYRNHRLEIETGDGNFAVYIQWRAQIRFSEPLDEDPQTIDEFLVEGGSSIDVRRGRLKVGGHAYRPWLDYSLEYDFPSTTLLDWRFTLEKLDALQLRVGQWKASFNRERVASSGAQQLVDRSLANDFFTVDRQQGLMLQGHVLRDTPGDSWYHVAVFTGTGRGGDSNDDGEPMWVGRWQWNFLGRDLDLEQSDIDRTERPTASIALAGVRNRSPFTRFSSGGGGQLPGFEEGVAGQYHVEQALLETAFKWRGFSFQHESHRKDITDRVNRRETEFTGGYLQAGYFFHEAWSAFPEPLEIAARYAWVDSEGDVPFDPLSEKTIGANWFFAGHKNKLSADVSWLELDTLVASEGELEQTRVRLQWDISF